MQMHRPCLVKCAAAGSDCRKLLGITQRVQRACQTQEVYNYFCLYRKLFFYYGISLLFFCKKSFAYNLSHNTAHLQSFIYTHATYKRPLLSSLLCFFHLVSIFFLFAAHLIYPLGRKQGGQGPGFNKISQRAHQSLLPLYKPN